MPKPSFNDSIPRDCIITTEDDLERVERYPAYEHDHKSIRLILVKIPYPSYIHSTLLFTFQQH